MTTTSYNIQNEGAFTSRPLFLTDDSDFSSRDDEEYVANMDFMAIESDNEVLFQMMSPTSLIMNYMIPLNHCMMNLKSYIINIVH
jgi:hypothetical protein